MSEITLIQKHDDCTATIIAVHDKYYVREIGSSNTTNYIGEDFDLPTQYTTISALDTYIHAITINSNTYYYPPAITNPTTPVLIKGNETNIQSFINSKLVLNGYSANDLKLVVNIDNSITVWRNPNFTYNGDEFWLGTNIPDNYTNKTIPIIPTIHYYNPVTECIAIQEIKESNECNENEETYRYIVENGQGLLLPVIDIYPNFTELSVKKECCGKQIIAVEQKYLLRNINIPSNYSIYWLGDTLSNIYGTGYDATNIYLHLIYGILDGSAINPPIGSGLQDYFSVIQNGVVMTDITTIQAMIDVVLPLINLNIGDIVYGVTVDKQPIVILSPNAVSVLSNNTYLHVYVGDSATYNNYNNKLDFNHISSYTISDIATINVSSNIPYCVGIQEIKYLNTCTGYYTYDYVMEQNGQLVHVIDIYADFTESDVITTCPTYTFNTKEICGFISGSTTCYEIYKIEVRDKNTGELMSVTYEDKDNNVLTEVEETCCACDCLCQLINTYNRVCFSYATLFNGRDLVGDRVVNGANFFIEYLWVNGNVIINTQTAIGSTTGGLTTVNVGYGLAYNKIVDLLNSSSYIQNAGIYFVPAAYPNSAHSNYDPMSWGIKYNSSDEIRLVISDYIAASNITHTWSIRLHPTISEAYDAIGDARVAASWNYTDIQNILSTINLVNCGTI